MSGDVQTDARVGAPNRVRAMRITHGALRRAGRTVLDAGEHALPLGATIALVGANGAGKSTLLLAIAHLLSPAAGRAAVTLDEVPVAHIGWVPQQPALPPWLPLADALVLLGAPADTAAVLRDTARARRVGELSPGQLQALCVAAILARRDPLVLLDEPFASVDIARRTALRARLAERRARQPEAVIVLSSHVASDLGAHCDWLIALRDGRCSYAGPLADLPPSAGAPDDLEARLAAVTG